MESGSEGRGSPFVITQKGREKCDAGGGLRTLHGDLFLNRCPSASLLPAQGMGELSVCSVTGVGWKGLGLSASSRRAPPSLLPSYKNMEVVRAIGGCWWVSGGVLSGQ